MTEIESEANKNFRSADHEEEPAVKVPKMSADSKTPITILTELCTKKRAGQPTFTEIDQSKLPKNFPSAPQLKFFMQAKALNKVALGAGATKKSAKHAAAQNLLVKINSSSNDNSDDDDDDDDFTNNFQNAGDYISELLNFCTQRNYHKAELVDIDAFGPTHCPVFIAECRLDSIAIRASACTKQNAKQQAARKVLEIVKASYPDMEKKVAVVNSKNLSIDDEARRKITTYLDLRNRGKTELMGTTIAERHNFFVRYKNEQVTENLQRILREDAYDDETKCGKLLEALQAEWGYSITTCEDNTQLKIFELFIDFDQFCTVIFEEEAKLKARILEYFSLMLDDSPIYPRPAGDVFNINDLDMTLHAL